MFPQGFPLPDLSLLTRSAQNDRMGNELLIPFIVSPLFSAAPLSGPPQELHPKVSDLFSCFGKSTARCIDHVLNPLLYLVDRGSSANRKRKKKNTNILPSFAEICLKCFETPRLSALRESPMDALASFLFSFVVSCRPCIPGFMGFRFVWDSRLCRKKKRFRLCYVSSEPSDDSKIPGTM
jgi:hypothetical protein